MQSEVADAEALHGVRPGLLNIEAICMRQRLTLTRALVITNTTKILTTSLAGWPSRMPALTDVSEVLNMLTSN